MEALQSQPQSPETLVQDAGSSFHRASDSGNLPYVAKGYGCGLAWCESLGAGLRGFLAFLGAADQVAGWSVGNIAEMQEEICSMIVKFLKWKGRLIAFVWNIKKKIFKKSDTCHERKGRVRGWGRGRGWGWGWGLVVHDAAAVERLILIDEKRFETTSVCYNVCAHSATSSV